MKHDTIVTVLLVFLFLAAQIVGLFILSKSINIEKTIDESGNEKIIVNYSEVITGRPETTGSVSFLYILASVFIGTLLLLLLVKLKLNKVWKVWFLLAVGLTLTITFNVFFNPVISLVLGFLLAIIKVYKPNFITHNIAEVLMYSGIAILIVPMFDITWIIALLIAISIYDFIAVFKSKHMITLAKFQSGEKMFAGLVIPYEKHEDKKETKTKIKIQVPTHITGESETGVRTAILGGGDIAFPLIFAGVVMSKLLESGNITKLAALEKTLLIPAFAAIGLIILLYLSKKDKFYPAMPFISAGCLAGYGIIQLL
ncbi:MAG: presenilin family intramembrane aspartyl protease [archaeon]